VSAGDAYAFGLAIGAFVGLVIFRWSERDRLIAGAFMFALAVFIVLAGHLRLGWR